MSKITDNLNPAQLAAVVNYRRASLIVAGAGSGKTRVLTCRIAYMIEQGVAPGSILALTFTNKAAREMRERIERLVPDGSSRYIWMGTFHSVFNKILRIEAEKLGFTSDFTIYDTSNSESLINQIIRERNLSTDDYKARDIHSRISLAKNNLVTAGAYASNSTFLAEDRQRRRPEFAGIYSEYMRRCKLNNAMDFDDLLLYINILFRDFPEVLEKYQQRFQYILVDEYQDTNYAQYLIVCRLAAAHQNVCVVGDDAQSIYSFRGAKIENILKFQHDFPNAGVFKLEQNYRSTQTIVNAANSIIARNSRQIRKEVFSQNDVGEKVKVVQAYTDREEAAIVSDMIKLLGHDNGGKWNETAVLYRNNAQSRNIEEALRRKDIPYRIYSGRSFYDRKEIKDIIAYFRLIVNPKDNEAFRRIVNTPARGIGPVTVGRIAEAAESRGISMMEVVTTPDIAEAELKTAAKKSVDFGVLITSLSLDRTGKSLYEYGLEVATRSGLLGAYRMENTPEAQSAVENIGELINSMQTFKEERLMLAYEDGEALNEEPTIEEWLQNVSLMTDMDKGTDEGLNHVMLMTIHAAKGLEFNNVFIVGVEENLFPGVMSVMSVESLEEERRLFYVALTRAKERATVSFARQRFKWGNMETCRPSRFISEMDSKFVDLPADLENGGEESDNPLEELRKRYGGGGYGAVGDSQRPRPRDSANTKYYPRNSTQGAPSGERSSPKPIVPRPVTDPSKFKSMGERKVVQSGEESDAITRPASTADYTVGNRVEHRKFGRGVIEGVEDMGSDIKVTVRFDNAAVGRKSLLAKYANLSMVE